MVNNRNRRFRFDQAPKTNGSSLYRWKRTFNNKKKKDRISKIIIPFKEMIQLFERFFESLRFFLRFFFFLRLFIALSEL